MNELKVGLFTLLALGSLVFVSIKITGDASSLGPTVEYKTYLNDASGIFPKTPIRVAGIDAGKIKSIELAGDQALVTFEVDSEIKITKGSMIKIKTVGFLGDKYIEIALGPKDAPLLTENALLKADTGGGLENLANNAGELIEELKVTVKSIKESVVDDDNSNALRKIVQNIKDVSQTIRNVTTGKEQSLANIVDNIEKLTKQLAFESDRKQDGSFMHDMDKIGPILENANKAMEDLKIVMADLKAGKGTIGKLMRDEDVVDQVSQTLSSVNRLMNRINNIEADIALFTGVNTDGGDHTQFDLDLYPAPERFFRLGLVQSDVGPDGAEERTITSTTGGVTTVENRREVEKDKFKFNLQIGRRIQRFAFRAGLIQTTGGVGVDYLLPDYGTRFTLEAFDYQEDIGPNIRLMAELRMWNVFYTRISGEDLINGGNQSMTIFAGLRFTDKDLAALLGLLAM